MRFGNWLVGIWTVALLSSGNAYAFVGCPTGDVAENVFITGDCIIAEGTTIDGNIVITDGFLDVRGTVIGLIIQIGDADGNMQGEAVEVGASGVVNGDIVESGGGSVWIDGTVNGNIVESGEGQVRLFNVPDFGGGPIFGVVNGDIWEFGDGGIVVESELNGAAVEFGPGGVGVGALGSPLAATLNGPIWEFGDGLVFVATPGVVNGDVVEFGAGAPDGPAVGFSAIIDGTVNGNVRERAAGSVLIRATGVVDGNVRERGEGTVTNNGTVTGTITES